MKFHKTFLVLSAVAITLFTASCGDGGWKGWVSRFDTLITELDELRSSDSGNTTREQEIVTEIETLMYEATENMESIPEKVYPEIETAYKDMIAQVKDSALKSSLIEFYSRVFEESYY